MDIQSKIDIVKQVGEEIITLDDLRNLFETKSHPVAYDGFEPSGKLHIAQGLMRAQNLKLLSKTGIKFKILVADWYAMMNNKMDGDLDKIRITGKYFIETWKACGLDTKDVEFLWAEDIMKDPEYWKRTVKIAKASTLQRITRCCQIMGRSETENLSAAQIFYPCMQCSDIFHLNADIAQLGMDQRKVNMLAREVAPKLGLYLPVAVHNHMLMGLSAPQTNLEGIDRAIAMKMSKSKPDTAIFMTDSEEEIKRKFNKAYCPEGQEEDNPVLEYCKYILFNQLKELKIERPQKFGGDLSFESYEQLVKTYKNKQLHPMDLKNTVAREINILVKPVREHFEKNKKAKELKEQVESFIITR